MLLADTTADVFDLHMEVNARAPMLIVNAALPYLEKSSHASVINVGSVLSIKGYDTQGHTRL